MGLLDVVIPAPVSTTVPELQESYVATYMERVITGSSSSHRLLISQTLLATEPDY